MKPSKSRKKTTRQYSKHGLTAMKSALSKPGARAIDRRTKIGRALLQWRNELIEDLGGVDAVTTQQLAIGERPKEVPPTCGPGTTTTR